MKKYMTAVVLVLAAGCSSTPRHKAYPPPMDPTRTVNEQVCTGPIRDEGGNLLCRNVTEADRRAMLAEKERQASAQKEAWERDQRERLERERAEKLAREEAARRRAAEEARLAAERRRLAAEAERRAQEEHERQMREQAEALARVAAAREAAARECRRLDQEGLEGRAVLANFVAKYGKLEEFKEIAEQITAFLNAPRKVKPCPPA